MKKKSTKKSRVNWREICGSLFKGFGRMMIFFGLLTCVVVGVNFVVESEARVAEPVEGVGVVAGEGNLVVMVLVGMLALVFICVMLGYMVKHINRGVKFVVDWLVERVGVYEIMAEVSLSFVVWFMAVFMVALLAPGFVMAIVGVCAVMFGVSVGSFGAAYLLMKK